MNITIQDLSNVIRDYEQRQFPDGNIPTDIANTIGQAITGLSTILSLSVNYGVGFGGGSAAQAAETLAALAPFTAWLSGFGLATKVGADLGTLANAYQNGDATTYQATLNSMASGIALACLAVVAIGPGIGVIALAYMVGELIYSHEATIGNWLSTAYGFISNALDNLANWLGQELSPLLNWLGHDPLVIDLNHNGYDLTALGTSATGSQVHFDYGNDGFAERTGWVAPTDGILVHDKNGNGLVDDAAELFGSTNVDGFDVLALMDTNADGKINASDAKFSELRIWQDLNGNGAVDAGEMHTLVEMGITSISLARSKSTLTINGNTIGYESLVTFADGSTTTAGTAYMKTDGQNTLRPDNTPTFTMGQDVDKLPQLPGSGLINSIAYKASTDAGFKAAWTALTDNAGNDNTRAKNLAA
jgi:hypothetical protein